MRLIKFFTLMILIMFFFMGCARTIAEPFESHKHANLAPFADQLIAMVGNIQFGMDTVQPVYLSHYHDIPEIAEYREMFHQFRINAGKILAYSSRVVTLSKSNLKDAEKAKDLADYVDKLRPLEQVPLDVKFSMTPEQVDQILDKVRKQETYTDALTAVLPLTDEVARFMREYVDELDEAGSRVAVAVRQGIVAEHKNLLVYRKVLIERQDKTMWRSQELYNYQSGDSKALERLLKEDPELQEIIKPGKTASYQDLKVIEKVLTGRLALINSQFKHISTQWDIYLKQEKELRDIVVSNDKALRRAKLAMIIWGRVNRQMAAGIVDPAKIDVFGLAEKAVSVAF